MILAIDPGYSAMGYALFKHGRLADAGVYAERSAVKGLEWFEKVKMFQNALAERITRYHRESLRLVVCEEMAFRSNASGMAAAATSLMGLAGTVGMWAAFAHQEGAKFKLAPIVQWKGQLPKKVVNGRIRKILSQEEINHLTVNGSHDWDAAGIGLWHQGRFK